MLATNIRCICCTEFLPLADFAPANPSICRTCDALPKSDLILRAMGALMSREPVDRFVRSRNARRGVKRAADLATYARVGKRCSDCHARKPAAEFGACNSRVDGLQPNCKACLQMHQMIMRKNKKEPWLGKQLWTSTRDSMRIYFDAINKAAAEVEQAELTRAAGGAK